MGRHVILILCAGLVLISQFVLAQPKRILYNNQQLFLNGLNLAWINYRNDVGSTIPTDTATFGDIFLQVHNAGGNAVRWWIHTDGSVTPQFSTADSSVIGPGSHTLADMKKVLDLAWQNAIGVNICLWAFDMLNTSNSAFVLARNQKLLNDTNYTRAYINNCIIPMVNSLKVHPAIIDWEIFNEPEGMATEFGGFGAQQLVPMSVIQRFINLCAGAIHRTDPSSKVTNGANSFYSLTDNTIAKIATLPKLSEVEKAQLAEFYQRKYHSTLSPDEILHRLESIANNDAIHQNYYCDDRLINAGGDSAGVLDFYSVHYYGNVSNTTSISPFHHMAVTWGLSKPIVVAEFAMEPYNNYNPPGIAKSALYYTLYQLGYAGALAWSWTDAQISSQTDMLMDIQSVWNNHKADVAVNKIVFDWPSITISNPPTGTNYTDSTSLTFYVTVSDTLPISSVIFFNDTTKIGTTTSPSATSKDTSFYIFRWNTIAPGNYIIRAIATNSGGHSKVSNLVSVSVGKPPMMRLEAESAALQGSNMTVVKNASASGGAFVDIKTNDATAKVTWYFNNVDTAGHYDIAFGYRLAYNTPKSQFINVNGVCIDTMEFTATSITTWYEKILNVPLVHGSNNIQMQMFWGWMYIDYLAVPKPVLTSVQNTWNVPTKFALEQNYPNPFNPTTTIRFSMPKTSNVKLIVYNLLGQKVAMLANQVMDVGVYTLMFNAAQLASGVYFYRLEAGTFIAQKKMLLLR